MNAKDPITKYRKIFTTGATLTRFNEVPYYDEGLYEVAKDTYAWMVPNGSWGEANSGLIVGNGESLLVDTLWDLRCTKQMIEAIKPITDDSPVNTVVNTHSDGDHFWGNQLFPNIDIIATQACKDLMHHTQPKSLSDPGRLGSIMSKIPIVRCKHAGNWFKGMVKPYDYSDVIITPANRTFTKELTVNVGGREVILMEMGPAHTSGDAIVYVPDAKVVYSGDLLFVNGTPPLWAGPVENWIKALVHLLSMDVETFVPGHGPLTDKAGVERVKDYWEFIFSEVKFRHQAGMQAGEIAREIIFSEKFARYGFMEWDSPERLYLSAHTLCKHLDGNNEKHYSKSQIIGILGKQGKLAHELPMCRPKCMHTIS